MTVRRLLVLSAHPRLGKPNDVRDEFDGAQAYVDHGFAEWLPEPEQVRTVQVETTDEAGPPETTAARPSARRTRR